MDDQLHPHETPAPRRRVVLLGASNLARAFPAVVGMAQRLWGEPLDVLAAIGHGRSYGVRGALLGRSLSGIVECGLWDALRQRPGMPTAALLTDVGNDLLYELPPETIAGWVAECLDRLRGPDARVVLTRLPLPNLRRLSRAKFLALRTMLYPRSRLSFSAALERAEELDERLVRLAADRGSPIVGLRESWYGFDPIHIRRRHFAPAWSEILNPWTGGAAEAVPLPFAPGRWLRYQRLRPERYRRLGIERYSSQPAAAEKDGTTLSLY